MVQINQDKYGEICFKSSYKLSFSDGNYIEVWDSHLQYIKDTGLPNLKGTKYYFSDRQIGIGTSYDEDKYFFLGKTVCPISNKQVTRIDPDFKHNGKYNTVEGAAFALPYNINESFTRYATPEHLDSIPIKLIRYYERFSIIKNDVTGCHFHCPNILLAPRCNKRNIPFAEYAELCRRYPAIFIG